MRHCFLSSEQDSLRTNAPWGLHSGLREVLRKTKQEPPVPPCHGVSSPLTPACPAWFLSSYYVGLLKLTVCSAPHQPPGSVLALWWLWWGGGEETQGALRRLVITSILSHLAIPPSWLWPQFMLWALRHEALSTSQYFRSWAFRLWILLTSDVTSDKKPPLLSF